MKKKKVKIGIISLGCPRNLVDSEFLLGALSRKGYRITEVKDADIAFVNTCSFIEDAKKESIDVILDLIDLKKKGRIRKLIIAGCLVQHYKGEIASNFKEADAFIGRISPECNPAKRYPLAYRHSSYVKISEGCRNLCSFCVIPKIKGPLESRSMDSILQEVSILDSRKISEINIIGQDISSYGLDLYKNLSLCELLEKIAIGVKNIRWIRLLYLYPGNINDELIGIIARQEKICKYIDLPLQHINSRILKAMNRSVTKIQTLRLLERIRKVIPQAALRTSFIVGFPGESEKEFRELADFVEGQRFQRMGVFKYSREEMTPAYNYPGQIPERVKEERFDYLMKLQQGIAEEFNRGFLEKEVEVLIDQKEQRGMYLGRLSIDAPEVDGTVYVKANSPIRPGEFRKVRITDTYEYDLVGETIN